MKPALVALVLLSALGCARPRLDAPPPPAPPSDRAQLPVRVTWEERSRGPNEAVVIAKLERLVPIDTPFTVRVEVPAGAKVTHGRTSFTVLPNTEALTVTEELTFAYEATPADDAMLLVDADTGAMGFHFKVPWRFGRPAPAELQPKLTGPALKKGDRNFGPSIPLD